MFQKGRDVVDGTFGVRIPDDDDDDDDDDDLDEAVAAPMPPTMLKKLKSLSPEALRLLNTMKDNPKYRGQAASDAAKNALDKSGLTSTIHALEDPAKDVVRLTKMGQKVVAALKKRGLSAVQVVKESVAGAPGAFAISDAEPPSLEAMKADLIDRCRNPRWEYPSWALPKVKLDEAELSALKMSKWDIAALEKNVRGPNDVFSKALKIAKAGNPVPWKLLYAVLNHLKKRRSWDEYTPSSEYRDEEELIGKLEKNMRRY
jgi:hypothetical protein